jgi:hypothetical protein
MKNVVRALALALVATGAVASAHTTSATAKVSLPRTGALPVPTCPPHDPTGCGVCQFNGNCN